MYYCLVHNACTDDRMIYMHNSYPTSQIEATYDKESQARGGIEARPGTEKRCSHNLQSGPVKTWTAVFVIINISDRRSTHLK